MRIQSPAFSEGSDIPSKYTCDGEDISPPLEWSEVPEGTQSFILIVDDPDAMPVAGHVWDHWVLFNIPPNTTSIPENSSVGREGKTHFNHSGYGGPCPPNGMHTYIFKLYALDTTLDLSEGASKEDVNQAMQGHVLSEAKLTGKYDRVK